MSLEEKTFFNDKNSPYYKYNPIIQYAIRPALRLANAHDHPIRGGIAAAVASGIAHYGIIELFSQASDYFLGTNLTDPETRLALTKLPVMIHVFFGINILSNIMLGVGKYYQKKENLVARSETKR